VTSLAAPSTSRLARWLWRLVAVAPVAAAFVLALTRIQDPDAFTHLALGRQLLEQRGFPAREPFSFTTPDSAYYNPEWLFGLVLQLVYLGAGAAGVVLLTAAIVALAAAILWLDSRPADEGGDTPGARLSRAAILTLLVVMMRHRFVERPDVALMVFLALTIYALNAYLTAGRRLLVGLPLLSVVWANVQPSIIVSVVPFLAVLGGGVALRLAVPLAPRLMVAAAIPTWRQLAMVAAVFVASLVASLVNPYTTDIHTLPFKLAEQPWFRQAIGELQAVRWSTWPGPFVVAGFVVLSLLLTVSRVPLLAVLLVVPFAYLGFSAVRFTFLFLLVAAPILARNAALVADRVRDPVGRRLVLGGAGVGFALAIVSVVVTAAGTGPFNDVRSVPAFGVGLDERRVAERALRYLDARGVEGRLFNTFHFGGYITWRDFPKRVPIIDGRGHVPPALLDEIHFAHVSPPHLERLRARYGLEAAVMAYPVYSGQAVEEVIGPDADPALASPEWALVYWDDVALVYLPRRGRHAAVIERDEYRTVKPATGVAGLTRWLGEPTRLAAARAELSRNVEQTGSSLGLLLLAHTLTDPEQALATLERVRDPVRRFEADQAMAMLYRRRKDFARASEAYERALAREAGATVLYQAGLTRVEAGDDRGAARYLARAQRVDPNLTEVYPALIGVHRRLGDEAAARELGSAFLAAVTRARVGQHLAAARGQLAHGRTAEAGDEVTAALQLDARNALTLSTLGFVRLAERRLDEATRAEEEALALDPRLAQAHWALALIARARGDEAGVRRHLATFARLAPGSYEAWRAREALASAGAPPAGR
jgi:tetratricopeptide (TPR) repeat protein